jgi:hypothetical protein
VIDPVLAFSTYLGGGDDDAGMGIAVGDGGSVFVTGWTISEDFPTLNEYQPNQPNYDAYVTKMNNDGDGLIYSTYIGGTGADYGRAIAVDDIGNAYITGETNGEDFPTLNEYQTSQPGWDAFVTKLNNSGNGLIYSTYLGGDNNDNGHRIEVDIGGSAYVVGVTASGDFPTHNPYQMDQPGVDAFVTKFHPDGFDLLYSTYLGGSSYDAAVGVAVDQYDNAYVTGVTISDDFPLLTPFQVDQEGEDAFVTKLNSNGGGLIYSTYLGGDGSDRGNDIAIDAANNAYVTGNTYSSDFPTLNPYQTDQPGADAFLTKLNATGDALEYSTYLGGSGTDFGWSIAVDYDEVAYIAGETFSTDFPTVDAVQADQGIGDAFVIEMEIDGSAPYFSTYLGGNGDDECTDIAYNWFAGGFNVTGFTYSVDFPTLGPYQTNLGGMDAFVAKFDERLCGDVNDDMLVNPVDIVFLVNYLWLGGPPPFVQSVGDVDRIPGINNHDAFFINHHIFQESTDPYCPPYPDSILPVSSDEVFVERTTATPGATEWYCDIYILMNPDTVLGISLPISFSCSNSSIVCDSISFVHSIYTSGAGYDSKFTLIDTAGQKAVIGIPHIAASTPPADTGQIAKVWFSLDATVENKRIVIDTTTYPYGDEGEKHNVIFSKHIAGEAYACVPTFEGIGKDPWIVTNLLDTGIGTLRNAMQYSSGNPGVDTVVFEVSGVIQPATPLPVIDGEDPVLIWGGSAPGGDYSVIVDGSALFSGHGFFINSSGNFIQGLVIRNFPENGIVVGSAAADLNEFWDNLIYDNAGLGIDLGNDGVTVNDPLDLDTGANGLMNYPVLDSAIMLPDSSFMLYGTTEDIMIVTLYVAYRAKEITHQEDPSGHGEAYEILGAVASAPDSEFEFPVPNSVPFFSVITMTGTSISEGQGAGATSEFSENITLVPSPLVIYGYSPINIMVTDPVGDRFGKISPADYFEEPDIDSVVIYEPIRGTYTIEIYGTVDADPGDTYSMGVRIDGTTSVIVVDEDEVPLYGTAPDEVEYEVEEDWHYVNGDADRSGGVDIDDVVYLISYIFSGGPPPDPPDAGDANCSYDLDIDDVVYLIAYIFSGGPEPCVSGEKRSICGLVARNRVVEPPCPNLRAFCICGYCQNILFLTERVQIMRIVVWRVIRVLRKQR